MYKYSSNLNCTLGILTLKSNEQTIGEARRACLYWLVVVEPVGKCTEKSILLLCGKWWSHCLTPVVLPCNALPGHVIQWTRHLPNTPISQSSFFLLKQINDTDITEQNKLQTILLLIRISVSARPVLKILRVISYL